MIKKELLVVIIVSICLIVLGMFLFPKKDNNDEEILESSFREKIIRSSYQNNNYLISPYSIEIALNMVREGSNGNTKKELDDVLGNRVIYKLNSDKLHVANAIFVKDYYKNAILSNYYNTLKDKYSADVLYDKFTSPKVINDWVSEHTNKMIEKILDSISNDFVLGIANALSLDIRWQDTFTCDNTREAMFTKLDGSKIKVSMMHNTYSSSNYKIYQKDDTQGIIIPYQKDSNNSLVFIAIMPKDIQKYIENFSEDYLDEIKNYSISASSDLHINVSLPRFSYEYEINDFIELLKTIGIHDAFDAMKADFTNIMKKESMMGNIYISDAIHKTKIELNETGTKAAAVTYFGFKDNALLLENKVINIDFNKPFVYMIMDENTQEIVFFGSIFTPEIWHGNTCSN